MVRNLLFKLPGRWAICVAWVVIALPIVVPVGLVGALSLPILAQANELAEMRQQVSQLSERVTAGEAEFRSWHGSLARAPDEVTEYFDRSRSRETFEAAYDRFVLAADTANIQTRQAGAVREIPVTDTVGDFQARWVGRGSPEAVIELLLGHQQSSLRIASFAMRSTDAQGAVEVDAVIEFRKSFLLDGAVE
ncbi:hypothetical protein [Maricaulis sp.]|uniref:hypothetical protein n=1 Tax=Maricaulis sp. TaxID=1486257 RepID=UPI002B26A04A|nr:hypothetical protein [Maricaulis sp.]